MSETALVTGGAGFLGSWLCEHLIEKGFKVTCVDNLGSGESKNLENLDVEFIKHDVTKPLEAKADLIYHLASRASPPEFLTHPVEILLSNSLGMYNMLNLAKENNAKFLFASTSEVYGDPLENPQKETYWGNVNPTGIRSCYDESKRFGEALAVAYMRKFGTEVRLVRIFNTYGPRMRKDDGRVVSNFINQCLEKKPITIYGDGKQTRSFCYVTDLVEGIQKVMEYKENGEVFNIGNPIEITILELAEKIKELCDCDSELVFEDLPEDDPKIRQPDITKAKKLLNWEPKTSIEDGLKKTIAWYKEN